MDIRCKRMNDAHQESVRLLESKIRYTRKRLTTLGENDIIVYHTITLELDRLKEELFKLRGQWQDKFTHSKKKVIDSDGQHFIYIIEAKYGSTVMQESICMTCGKWWSAGCGIESTDHREVEQEILQGFKNYWGI